jgi:hypothetical protein
MSPYIVRRTILILTVVVLLSLLGLAFYFDWSGRVCFRQIPATVTDASNLPYVLSPDSLTLAPNMTHLEPGDCGGLVLIIPTKENHTARFGVEVTYIGSILARSLLWDKNYKRLKVPPVNNDGKRVAAKMVATGTVYDGLTRGATASCFVSNLQPGKVLEVPFTAWSRPFIRLATVTYNVLVKIGPDVRCETTQDASGHLQYTGLLAADAGNDYQLDIVPVTVGSLE